MTSKRFCYWQTAAILYGFKSDWYIVLTQAYTSKNSYYIYLLHVK